MEKLVDKFTQIIREAIWTQDYVPMKATANRLVEETNKIVVAFGEWILKEEYEKIHNTCWVKKYMSFTYSTDKLFEKFLKEGYEKG
jgi:hypothetical protein